jgi:oligopeptide transport system substrate-binding protein
MKKILASLTCISLLFFSGCVAEKNAVINEVRPYIVYSSDKIPADLMVLDRRSEEELEFINAIFEGLVSMDEDGDVEPALAEDWEISEDKLEYRFLIRDDARWSDGSEITAQDFVSFFATVLSKKNNNMFYYQLNCIYGVDDYYYNRIKANGLGIKAEDDKTLVIRLNYPYEDLLKVLAMPIYTLRNDINKLNNWKMNYDRIKYSGAFAIKNIDKDNNIILEKNDYYWDRDEVADSKFLIKEKNSKESALAEYETSKVDMVANPPISEVSRLMESENTIVVKTLNKIGISFNFSEKSIGSDKNFRKAISQVIDPETIAEKALSEYSMQSEYNSQEAVNVFKNTAEVKSGSVVKANEYLKGYNDSKLKNIRLIALNTDKNKRICNSIKENIQNDLKVTIKVTLLESYDYDEAVKNRDFDMLLTTFPFDYDKELSILEKFTSKSVDNYGKYLNFNYDTAFSKAKLEEDTTKKRTYMKTCTDILNEDVPVVYLFNDVKLIAKSSDLAGLDVDIFGNINFKNIYRER